MGRVSKYKLNQDVEAEMFRLFWSSLTKLRGADEVSSFFTDLLTETEEVMLVKRFAIAVLLLRNKKPIEISGALHVSYTTIGSVAAWLKNAKPHTRKVLDRIIGEQDWQALLDRIDRALLELHPSLYTTKWALAGKMKQQTLSEIATRDVLRK